MKSFGVFLRSGASTTPGATALKRMLFLAYSFERLRVIASRPPLADHRNRCRKARDGVLEQRRRDGCHTSTRALRQDLFHCDLGDEDEPFQVGGNETAKHVGGVVTEGLGYADARGVCRCSSIVCAVERKMHIAGIRLLRHYDRAGWRDLRSPQERSDSPKGRRDCADRSTQSPGVWVAGPPHPLR